MTMEKMKVTANPAEKVLIVERTFDGPRDVVFRAFTDCEVLKHWWGPREWPLTKCSLDFRPGGRWHYCMTGPDGTEAWGLGIYGEIQAPEWFVYTDNFSDAEGNINSQFPASVVTMQFEEVDGRTKFIGRSEFKSAEDLEAVIQMGMIPGMTESMDRLDEYLAQAN